MKRSSRSVVWTILSTAALVAGTACSRDDHAGDAITGGTGGGSGTAGEGGGGGGRGGAGGPSVAPEVDGQLVINELMAANALTAKDESGLAWPWIELLNPTDSDVPLTGYPRIDSPWANVPWNSTSYDIEAGGETLHLDVTKPERRSSADV